MNVNCSKWRICLCHCATSRKVAVSIPDGVIDLIFPAAMGAVVEIKTQKYFLGLKAAGA
jgi:hypothetical protein